MFLYLARPAPSGFTLPGASRPAAPFIVSVCSVKFHAAFASSTSYAYEAFRRTLTDTLYFYHADHLGTPLATTNGAGTLVWCAEHTPFGGIYALTVGTITNNLRFPGQYYDGETGLAQNYFRDYKHNTGRYWEPDPIGQTLEESNVYPYGGSNPPGRWDADGRTWPYNAYLFWQWFFEVGSPTREYGPGESQTREMASSFQAWRMRRTFKQGGCVNARGSSGHILPYLESFATSGMNATQTQVGGFTWTTTNVPGGYVRYDIHNTLSIASLLGLWGIPSLHKPRGGNFPFGGNVQQHFYWYERNPCDCK